MKFVPGKGNKIAFFTMIRAKAFECYLYMKSTPKIPVFH